MKLYTYNIILMYKLWMYFSTWKKHFMVRESIKEEILKSILLNLPFPLSKNVNLVYGRWMANGYVKCKS